MRYVRAIFDYYDAADDDGDGDDNDDDDGDGDDDDDDDDDQSIRHALGSTVVSAYALRL